MSDASTPPPPSANDPPPMVLPVRYPLPRHASRPSGGGSLLRGLLIILLAASLGLNVLLLFSLGSFDGGSDGSLSERFHSGKSTATDKIAVIRVDGVLMEGMLGYVHKQIEKAARDEAVKAVVLRINSPGGSITASDDLFKRLKELRDGQAPRQQGGKKPIVVSMASMAASGGYYIAMVAAPPAGAAPSAGAKYLFAERTSLTGSIGVYAAFPNISKLADEWGIRMDVIKAGDVKDSGSMFHTMTPQERAIWQSMVDQAYLQFLAVVEEGRPQLKDKLQEDIVVNRELPVRSGKERRQRLNYTRYLADGGIFTASDAKEYHLIDAIGYLEDAIKEVREQAGLGEDYKVVVYDRPAALLSSLLGIQAAPVDPGRLSSAAIPRLWYLSPQTELAGVLAAMAKP